MKRGLLLIVGLTAAWSMQAQDPQPTDEGIKRLIARSNRYRHGEGERSLLYARSLCGDDTNRFARLLYEVAQTNDARLAGLTIRLLGEYGTPSQLPFLYSQVSNTTYGADAVQSILKIEGITSNSVAMVESYLVMTNMVVPMREDTCLELLRRRNQQNPESGLSNYVDQCAFRFFGSDRVYSEWYDGLVQPLISGYKYSKRRLSVLRAVQRLGLTKYNDVFVTNAINELVAYPEANLPE